MKYTTFLFGNGIGRAINNDAYKIETGLSKAWDNGQLTGEAKEAILSCLRNNPSKIEIGENHLSNLYEIAKSCDMIKSNTLNPNTLLMPAAQHLSEYMNKFISDAASYFHKLDLGKNSPQFQVFINKFSDHIKANPVHIATLNYDTLIYDALNTKGNLDGFTGDLIDGFLKNNQDQPYFRSENFDKIKYPKGFYLHLHGSALFKKYNENIIKLPSTKYLTIEGSISTVVLHHIDHKEIIIEESPILSAYKSYFKKALYESDKIVILGYSGLDKHINQYISERIRTLNDDPKIIIIEKKLSKTLENRESFWKEALNSENIKIELFDNILDYDFHD